MNRSDAIQISALAAPIYAAMLTRATTGTTAPASEATTVEVRARAIDHAIALWEQTIGTEMATPIYHMLDPIPPMPLPTPMPTPIVLVEPAPPLTPLANPPQPPA